MSDITYTVFVEKAEGGESWGAWAPDLGVYSTGDTAESAIAAARDAIRENLEVRAETGRPIPEPSARTAAVTIAA